MPERTRSTPFPANTMPDNPTRNAVRAFVLSAILVAPVYGGQTAGQYLDDTTLNARTKAALVGDKGVSALDIDVEVYNRHVQLSGFVASAAEKTAALDAAGRVDGTRLVLDAIVVLPDGRSMGEAVDDTTLHAKLKTELARVENFLDLIATNTEVRNGHVILAGFVDHADTISAAENVVSAIKGVKQVYNFLVLKP